METLGFMFFVDKENYYTIISYRDKVMRYLERMAPHLLIPFLECVIFNTCNCDSAEEEGLDALNVLHDDIFMEDSASLSSSLVGRHTFLPDALVFE